MVKNIYDLTGGCIDVWREHELKHVRQDGWWRSIYVRVFGVTFTITILPKGLRKFHAKN